MLALHIRSMVKVGTKEGNKGLGDRVDHIRNSTNIVVGGMYQDSVGQRTNTMVVAIVGVTTHRMSADSPTR